MGKNEGALQAPVGGSAGHALAGTRGTQPRFLGMVCEFQVSHQ